MARGHPQIEHLLRRAGFGASADDLRTFDSLSTASATRRLVEYDDISDDVDSKIGNSAYASVTARGPFSPNTNIEDARQRWLFRMIHSQRPLQEKMALFWHNHFATAYSKILGIYGPVQATKMMALKRGELPGPQGQLELFRANALGNFRELLIEVAKDPAMLVWLDGRTNTRQRPQENFGREIMELFTFGIGNYTEQDVYAAARVFTGWNLRFINSGVEATSYYEFFYNANQHEPAAKTFTFPIYGNGGRTIPARSGAEGMQDGIDFIGALARHPNTARRLVRKLWHFLVSDVEEPDPATLAAAASVYLQQDTRIAPVVYFLLLSREFQSPSNWYTRYSWPVEFAVRAVKEVGWNGFSVDTARTSLIGMGQTLFEPPDVNGWELGQGWFTTGSMLSRMNFAATLALNQRFNLGRDAANARNSPEDLLALMLERLSPTPFDRQPYGELLDYLRKDVSWPPTDPQLTAKAAGLTRLILGSSEYQFM